MIRKIDSLSEAGIPGAVFHLTACNGSVCSGTTNANGLVTFLVLPHNTYTLVEVGTPAGYQPADHVYNICVNECGCILVDGVFTPQLIIRNTPISASFTAIKVNIITGMPLAGAVYALMQNSTQISSAVSDGAGQVTFTGLAPGAYQLVETVPPAGFQLNPESLAVVVAQDGSVTINGLPADGFRLNNAPLSDLSFRKVDALTGLPLPGATFALSQNGTPVGTTVSGVDGLVNFGILAAGMYQLAETAVPPGYQPNPTVYQVVVSADGSITVNGIPLEGFVVGNTPVEMSAPPVIQTILEGASVITGTGVPGASITVRLPNGTTISTTVDATGAWTVDVPAGVELLQGEEVSAVQIEPGKLVSNRTYATVQAMVEPFLEKIYENQTTPGEPAQPGDVLQFTIRVGNLGGAGSVWGDVALNDVLMEELSFIPGSVAIDGQLIPVGSDEGHYSFDDVTRNLSVYVGDLTSGLVRVVTFQVTVNPGAATEIVNTVTAISQLEIGPIIAEI